MQKLVNGQLVDLTQDEITARNNEVDKFNAQNVTNELWRYRQYLENKGFTFNGVKIQTDPNSRANLLGAVQLGTSIDWKTENGYVTLTAPQIAAIATAVGTYIQKCFTAEKTALAAHEETPFQSIAAVREAMDAALV